MIALVREAGGLGDIISCTAAARQVKVEHPDRQVLLLVPKNFVGLAKMFEGPDDVLALPSVGDLLPMRRGRDAPITEDLPYLTMLQSTPMIGARVVSLFCPAYLYESSCEGPLEYNRPQLFAMAAGCKYIDDVRPVYKNLSAIKQNHHDNPTYVVAGRATCPARCMPAGLRDDLLLWLVKTGGTVHYFDSIRPASRICGVNYSINESFERVAEIVANSRCVVTVDSFMLHFAAALDVPTIGVFGPTDGAAAVQTYPKTCAVEHVLGCELPCNYNTTKGWSKAVCRPQGCTRMKQHDAGKLAEAAELIAGTIKEYQL